MKSLMEQFVDETHGTTWRFCKKGDACPTEEYVEWLERRARKLESQIKKFNKLVRLHIIK